MSKLTRLSFCVSSLILATISQAQQVCFLDDLKGASDYLPQAQALTPKKRDAWLSQSRDPVDYASDKRRVGIPVLPMQIFGVRYEEDIVLETNQPGWRMHEYARLKIAGKDVWIAKDSDDKGVQTITSGLEHLETYAAEIPLPRHPSDVNVEDRSTPALLDVSLHYINPHGEKVDVVFSSPRPPSPQAKRNGSTFNHSQAIVSGLLDIGGEQMDGVKAKVSFDGKPVKIRKVLGIIPVKALLQQTQGGFAIASMQLTPENTGFQLLRPIPGQIWNTTADEHWTFEGDSATANGNLSFTDSITHYHYAFNNGELVEATAGMSGREVPLTYLKLSAPLPDLGRAFEGKVVRNFVVEIDGQMQGFGKMVATSMTNGAVVDILPEKPYWFAARPMRTIVTTDSSTGIAKIETKRLY